MDDSATNYKILPRTPGGGNLRQLSFEYSAPKPISERRKNLASKGITDDRLNGRVYTPMPTAVAMLERLPWPDGEKTILDPSCGDGVFLEAAIRKLAVSARTKAQLEAGIKRIYGWDIDPKAVDASRERVERVCAELGVTNVVPIVRHCDALEKTDEKFDIIAGNPPYLEAKRMPTSLKKRIKSNFPVAAKGSFDLYAAFVELSARLLNPGGTLSFLLPNRILVTKSGSNLRHWLLEQGSVRIADLSDSGIFGKTAAVYPVVFEFHLSDEHHYSVQDLGARDGMELPSSVVIERLDCIMPAPPAHKSSAPLLERVLTSADNKRLDELFQVRWCVSFHKTGVRDGYIFPEFPKNAVNPRRFLGGGRFHGNREVEPFRISWAGHWIDYDVERSRREHNILPPMSIFTGRKAVICQNARRGRAALDENGFILKDTFICVLPRPGITNNPGRLEWLVILLNSDFFHYMYEQLYGGTRKSGRFLQFLGNYLKPFPIAVPRHFSQVIRLHTALVANPKDQSTRNQAEEFIRRTYGVTTDEAALLDQYEYPAF
ncbi:MAG: N-6 DNA methylase [Deltaproteobacteria bacterium]|nr:N-6 DNA methylase [Deltaproteobacteria bacterium]